MKKTLILGLVALMLFLPLIAFTACTGENDDTNNDDITNQNENDSTVFQQSEWPICTTALEIPEGMTGDGVFAFPSYARHFEDLIDSTLDKGHYLPNGTFWSNDRPRYIFRGIVLSEMVDRVFIQYIDDRVFEPVMTINEILIVEVFYGALEVGETVTIQQLGAPSSGNFNNWAVRIPIGEEFLVFAAYETIEDERFGSKLRPLYNINSIFWIANPDDGRSISAFSDESVLESSAMILGHPEIGSFNITPENMEELANIARGNGVDVGTPIPAEVMERAQAAIDQRTEDLARWEAEQREVE